MEKPNEKTNIPEKKTDKNLIPRERLPDPRIPYGYRVRSGKAVIEPGEAQKILSLYHFYINGCSVRTAMQSAGISFGISKGRKILENPIYMGDEFYPAIIDRTLFDKASLVAEERRTRHGIRKGIPFARAEQPVPAHTDFIWIKPGAAAEPQSLDELTSVQKELTYTVKTDNNGNLQRDPDGPGSLGRLLARASSLYKLISLPEED